MSSTPAPPVASETAVLLRELADYVVPFAVRVVGDLKVADQLANGPRSAPDIAAAVGAHAPSLLRLLRLLAHKGVFDEAKPGYFTLTPLGELLRSDHPHSLQQTFPLMSADVRSWALTDYSIRTGRPSFERANGEEYYDYFAHHQEDSDRFDRSVQTLHLLMVRTILPAYDWGGIDTLVDVGSGNGAFAAELLARYPAMRAVLYDQRHVIAGARRVIEAAGVAERCELVDGDFFTSVPTGGDTYLLKTVLHDWDDERALRVLRSVRRAMSPTDRVVVLESIPRPGDDFDIGKVMDIKQLVLFGGYARTLDQFGQLFAAADLQLTAAKPTPTLVVIEARVAR